ncbi:MAG: hypothetical protein INH41_14080 [Myxococcaceae bacterium]|jgi:hypothetical protein|nr:hypothetical protein [Myxococcaceae bacterium]MCA3013507.1 hypothetical protein [Myxococcaceae bacterium]
MADWQRGPRGEGRRGAAVLAAAVGLAVGGCALDLERVRVELTPRAVTDLSCEASKLSFERVEVLLSAPNVLVSGCGQSREYRLEEGKWHLARYPRR